MPGSPIEWLADQAELEPEQLRQWLEQEVLRRWGARYRMHQHAYEQLDRRLERSALPEAGSVLTKT